MSAWNTATHIAQMMGWTYADLLAVICDYIDNQGQQEAFDDYLWQIYDDAEED